MKELPLNGLRILLVEDDFILATDAAMTIKGAGGKVVGPFATVEDARDALDANGADLAIIDINLGSGPAFDLARHLDMVGLPFLIASGYDGKIIPDDLKRVVRLEKPYGPDELISAAVGVYEATKAGGS